MAVRLNVIVSDGNAHETAAMVCLVKSYGIPHQVFHETDLDEAAEGGRVQMLGCEVTEGRHANYNPGSSDLPLAEAALVGR